MIKQIVSTVLILMVFITAFSGCKKKNNYIIDNELNLPSLADEQFTNSPTTTEPKTVMLDAFEGLIVDFDGVSPYCTIAFNNSKCSKEVQENIEYSLSPEIITSEGYFSIGDNVTVYASVRMNYSNDTQYSLKAESKSYSVKDVPAYITEITDEMDLSQLYREAQDYLEAMTAFSVDDYMPFDLSGHFKSKGTPESGNEYFTTLKINKYNLFYPDRDVNFFNAYCFTYHIAVTNTDDETYDGYFEIYAPNLVIFPDKHIGWGEDDPNSLKFKDVYSSTMESLINDYFTALKADYNVTQIK